MANYKLENVWERMRIYDFETVTELEDEILCVRCTKLLNNAHTTPCGCRFCFSCISEYLDGNTKKCPGNTEECQLELISLNQNIAIDNPMNIKISKLKVKCPEISCEFVDELRKIENHLRICNNQLIECPYSNIGCNKCKIPNDKMSNHFQSEILIHAKLLMDFVGNLNNEIISLKTDNNDLREVNKILKLNCERRQEEIVELQCNLDKNSRDIDQMNADISCLRNDNVSMREIVNKLILDEEKKQEAIREFDSKYQQIEKRVVNAKKKTKNKEKDLRKNIDAWKVYLKNDLAEMSNKFDKSMQDVDNKLLEIEINQNKLINEEFLWKIDNFIDKVENAKYGIDTIIYSHSFFSHKNGYKMCLYVYPNGYDDDDEEDEEDTHLSVYFCLMKGDFDDILEWPFRHNVTLALINQQTRHAHISMTTNYEDDPNDEALMKPTIYEDDPNNDLTNLNCGFGFYTFISHKELFSNSDLIQNDQIFIKCTVNILL